MYVGVSQLKKKRAEAMDLEAWYTGGLEGRKGKGEIIKFYFHSKDKN